MQLVSVKIDKTDDTNFILGQTHFIKSVEDRDFLLPLACDLLPLFIQDSARAETSRNPFVAFLPAAAGS